MAQGTRQKVYEALLERYGREVADAFLRSVDAMRSAADRQRLMVAIQANDLEAVLEALRVSEAAYEDMLESLRATYIAGGKAAEAIAADIVFSARNPRAEAWLRDHSSELVQQIVQDQREAVRTVLTGAMERGANPTSTVTRLVGATDRSTGKRVGGVLGLTNAQAGYVVNAQAELEAGDPASLNSYLNRARRDKRFDRSIEKALANGEPVPPETIRKATIAYERRLLALRAETLSRTEAMTALHQAQHEALLQAIDAGKVKANQVRRVWRCAVDTRVRESHRFLHSDSVGLNEKFKTPSGAELLFPGDPSAPAAERINCRCWVEHRIDFLANLR
ncbi:phage minor head protein [uncultured Brevundimonas sp.]|uniref:phage minor head protein n=1 Tax=uncultured Brevundimonas sp. TaxID=213418 RepID=UPI002633635B|nr:phage minor head protein [uncultured Brevundimonas sp.]